MSEEHVVIGGISRTRNEAARRALIAKLNALTLAAAHGGSPELATELAADCEDEYRRTADAIATGPEWIAADIVVACLALAERIIAVRPGSWQFGPSRMAIGKRAKATFAQWREGAADVGAVTSAGQLYAVVRVTADGVYMAPLGTRPEASLPPSPVWVLMTDVSADGAP